MERDEYKILKEKFKDRLKANNFKALLICASVLGSWVFLIYLSLTFDGAIWFLSQFLLAIVILQSFVLVHDLGHNNYFSSKPLNAFFGHLMSLPIMLPFYPWRAIHQGHHVWTGWKDRDPTQDQTKPKEHSEARKCILNFCWKFWVPLLTLAFSFGNFWNIKKIITMFPKSKLKNISSIIFLIIFYVSLISILGVDSFFRFWGLSYFIFLMLSDPLLISQHSSIPQQLSHGEEVKMIPLHGQDTFTRALIFPSFIRKYILMGFNQHILHHLFPTVPGYHLCEAEVIFPNSENWYDWLKRAKKTKGYDLILSSENNIKK